MRLRIQTMTLMLVAGGVAAWATNTLIAQVPPPVRTEPALTRSPPSLDQQVAALEKQVTVLQSQVNALLAVVRVTDSGVAGQRPNVFIAGQSIEIRSDLNTTLRAGNMLSAASSSGMDLRGSTIRLNGGAKPVATAGSPVQMQGNGAGQILNGSATVFSD